MLEKILDGIVQTIRDLIPSKDTPTTQWIGRMVTLVLLFMLIYSILYSTLRNTALGEKYGISEATKKPPISFKESGEIQKDIFSNYSRTKEKSPQIQSEFLIVSWDASGNLTYSDKLIDLGVFTWYMPGSTFISFQTFEQIINYDRSDYDIVIFQNKECILNQVAPANQERLKQAISNFTADQFIACPIEKNNKVYAISLYFWKYDTSVKQGLEGQKQNILTSAKTSTLRIEQYLAYKQNFEIK
jgi:hypothetical protein